jgi:hypothetical protein
MKRLLILLFLFSGINCFSQVVYNPLLEENLDRIGVSSTGIIMLDTLQANQITVGWTPIKNGILQQIYNNNSITTQAGYRMAYVGYTNPTINKDNSTLLKTIDTAFFGVLETHSGKMNLRKISKTGAIEFESDTAGLFLMGNTVSKFRQWPSGAISIGTQGSDPSASVGTQGLAVAGSFSVGAAIIAPVQVITSVIRTNNTSLTLAVVDRIALNGLSLFIKSGDCKGTTNNLNGGLVYIAAGKSTGWLGKSRVDIYRRNATTTANADNDTSLAVLIPSTKILKDAANDTLFSIALPTLSMYGGSFEYSVSATNGTDMQVHTGRVVIAAVNKGGVYTSEIRDESVDPANANSAGTLTESWSIATGTNIIYIITNFNSSLNPTFGNMKLYFNKNNLSNRSVTLF